jgi:hypothetical protein
LYREAPKAVGRNLGCAPIFLREIGSRSQTLYNAREPELDWEHLKNREQTNIKKRAHAQWLDPDP